ncbi:MAG TPA: hypothetical protein VGO07_00490 [Candidatus Saccharimonadales bacterium]|jgi:hypothetical protein|nr:hypothetical protein [Candidatus Saccharimonadales bacterium]
MNKHLKGFSVVELLVIVVIVGLVGAGGYVVYNRNHNKKPVTLNAPVNNNAPAGSTQSIDEITANDQNEEDSIDAQHANTDQSAAQSTNGAASNIGGAYDESSL